MTPPPKVREAVKMLKDGFAVWSSVDMLEEGADGHLINFSKENCKVQHFCTSMGWGLTSWEGALQNRTWDCLWKTSCTCGKGQLSPGVLWASSHPFPVLGTCEVMPGLCSTGSGVPKWSKSSSGYSNWSRGWSMCRHDKLGEWYLFLLGKRLRESKRQMLPMFTTVWSEDTGRWSLLVCLNTSQRYLVIRWEAEDTSLNMGNSHYRLWWVNLGWLPVTHPTAF